jgi:cardiolipin synthase
MNPRRTPRRFRAVEERFTAGNRVVLLRDGTQAFPAMLDAIDGARVQILLEMYWFASDVIGRRFAEALSNALARGVEVVVIYDSIGSLGADPEMFADLRRKGARVIEFNPISPFSRRFRLARLTRRDHRKILVVDHCIGFTGGINIGDAWLPGKDNPFSFRDDMVMVEGPAVEGFVACVRASFRVATGRTIDLEPKRRVVRESVLPPNSQAAGARVLGERHYKNRREIFHAYMSHLYAAERRAYISNAYFVPDRSVRTALIRAAKRGVDVRVLLPGESDVKIVAYASRAVWGPLLRGGVRIYEWHESVLHSKTAVVDGNWSTVGTFNLDSLSLRWNAEVNLSVLDTRFGAAVEASFLRDIELSREVDWVNFRFRPLGERLLELFAYRLRKFL